MYLGKTFKILEIKPAVVRMAEETPVFPYSSAVVGIPWGKCPPADPRTERGFNSFNEFNCFLTFQVIYYPYISFSYNISGK